MKMKMSSNVEDIIANLKLFNGKINVGLKENLAELGEYCQDVAKSNVISYDKDPTVAQNVKDGIILKLSEKQALIVANDENSAFYEYGTGLKGLENSHPLASQAGWEYNLDTPYKVVSTITGRVGWFHTFSDNSTKFTSGQPASAFMFKAYNATLIKSRDMLFKTIKEANDEALKGR